MLLIPDLLGGDGLLIPNMYGQSSSHPDLMVRAQMLALRSVSRIQAASQILSLMLPPTLDYDMPDV